MKRIRLLIFPIFFFPLLLTGQNLVVQQKLILSAPFEKESLPRILKIKNTDDEEAILKKLVINGKQATDFHLKTAISFPLTIKPNDSLELSFTFKPREKAGIHTATLEIYAQDFDNDRAIVRLYGLAAQGMEGENEPSLSLILKTLGYNLNVGSEELGLGISDSLLGDEIRVKKFVATSDRKVELIPIARYSAPGQVPFGYYYVENNQLRYKKIATLSAEYLQHQAIYPRLASGRTSFTPVDNSFGLFVSTSSYASYTDDFLNADLTHACRIYPLKNREGKVIEEQYLICFEVAEHGDYQDFIFIISNVRPAPLP